MNILAGLIRKAGVANSKRFSLSIWLKQTLHPAFTISELLIALGVIAILTTILLPIIHNLIPDQNVLVAKRSLYTTETIISSLINDNGCYPPIRARVGFDDGTGYRKCPDYDASNSEDANTKFLTLFKSKLDIKTDNGNSFFTKDGVAWNFQSINTSAGSHTVLTIDVNGNDIGPNCGNTQESTICDEARTKGFDKFTVHIYPTGKIDILDCWAILAVRVDKKIVGNLNIDVNSCSQIAQNGDQCSTKPQNADSVCCGDERWKDDSPCSSETDACANAPTSITDPCCKDDRWLYSAGCVDNSEPDPCPIAPVTSDSACCEDGRYANLDVCNPVDPCPNAPTSSDDACCSDERYADKGACKTCKTPGSSFSAGDVSTVGVSCCNSWANKLFDEINQSASISELKSCCNQYSSFKSAHSGYCACADSMTSKECCEYLARTGNTSKVSAESCCEKWAGHSQILYDHCDYVLAQKAVKCEGTVNINVTSCKASWTGARSAGHASGSYSGDTTCDGEEIIAVSAGPFCFDDDICALGKNNERSCSFSDRYSQSSGERGECVFSNYNYITSEEEIDRPCSYVVKMMYNPSTGKSTKGWSYTTHSDHIDVPFNSSYRYSFYKNGIKEDKYEWRWK